MRRRTSMETGKVIGRLSSKGQFTLPAEARRKIGLKKGDYLKSSTVGRRLILLERVTPGPFEEVAERLPRIAGKRLSTRKRWQH